jgi:hypothetical protein
LFFFINQAYVRQGGGVRLWGGGGGWGRGEAPGLIFICEAGNMELGLRPTHNHHQFHVKPSKVHSQPLPVPQIIITGSTQNHHQFHK